MGILWTVWPLDQKMVEWLDKLGIEHHTDTSRFPTGLEIKDALSKLEGYDIDITANGDGGPFHAFISKRSHDEWALLIVDEYRDHAEQKLWFEKGDEKLILRILKLLTPLCGPLALIADVGGDPIVVSRDGDLSGGI